MIGQLNIPHTGGCYTLAVHTQSAWRCKLSVMRSQLVFLWAVSIPTRGFLMVLFTMRCSRHATRVRGMRCLARYAFYALPTVAVGMPTGIHCCSGSSYALPSNEGMPLCAAYCCSGYAWGGGSAVAAGPLMRCLPMGRSAVAAGAPRQVLLLQRVLHWEVCLYALPTVAVGMPRGLLLQRVGQVLLLQRALLVTLCCSGCQHHSSYRGALWAQGGSLLQRPSSQLRCCSGLSESTVAVVRTPYLVRGRPSSRSLLSEGDGGSTGGLHSPDGPRHPPYSGNQPGCGRGPDARGIAHTRSRGWIAPLGMTACVRASPSAAHYWGRPVFERQPMTGCPGDSGQRDNLASSSSRLPYTLRGDLRRAGGRLGVLPLTLVCRPHG